MNTIDMHVKSVRKLKTTWEKVVGLPKFKDYIASHPAKTKQQYERLIHCINFFSWNEMEMLLTITGPLMEAHLLIARRDNPLSSWVLIVQALWNGIEEALNVGDGLFNHVLGVGSAKEVMDMIGPRFNMDGAKPAGQKVGLLDQYHIWAMIIDPFFCEWRNRIKITGSLPAHVDAMIKFFVNLDADGCDRTRRKVKQDYEVSLLYIVHNHALNICQHFAHHLHYYFI